jgi:hypothetical protein
MRFACGQQNGGAMIPEQRIVTSLPLIELWDDRGAVAADRVGDLTGAQVRELLKLGPVQFVMVDVGHRPEWISEADCYAFWRMRLSGNIADPSQPAYLDDFPGGYFYFASLWSTADGSRIVVLERQH